MGGAGDVLSQLLEVFYTLAAPNGASSTKEEVCQHYFRNLEKPFLCTKAYKYLT